MSQENNFETASGFMGMQPLGRDERKTQGQEQMSIKHDLLSAEAQTATVCATWAAIRAEKIVESLS